MGDTLIRSRYRLGELLGRGGLGETYDALDLATGERVALKLLSATGPDALMALRREFVLLRGLVHPHLCRLRDYGVVRGAGPPRPFYTSDRIDGAPLSSARDPAIVRRALADALLALGFLHRAGLRHGDFKPDNVLVDATGRGILIDLSAASPLGEPVTVVSGTPRYLAPEIVAGARVDARADLYAVGVTLEVLGTVAESIPAELGARLRSEDAAGRPASVDAVLDALGVDVAGEAPVLRPARFLGRRAILDAVDEALDALWDARAATRSIVFAGPPGCGRSRLLEEIKWRAQLRGDVVEVSHRAAEPIDDLLRRATGEQALPSGVDAVFAALDCFERADRPVVLIVDDAHRLDAPQRRILDALARGLVAAGRVALLIGDDERSPFVAGDHTGPSARLRSPQVHRLRGLDPEDARAWCADVGLSAVDVDRLAARTGLVPGLVERALRSVLDGGRIDDLADDALAVDPVGLGPAAQRALGVLSLLEGAVDATLLGSLAIDEGASELVARGVARPDERAGYRLAVEAHAASYRAALPDPLRARVDDEVLAELPARADTPAGCARRIEVLERLGRTSEARARFVSAAPLRASDPAAFRRVAAALSNDDEPRTVLAAARTSIDAGEPAAALAALDRIEPRCTGADALQAVRLGAEAELKLGRPGRASERLDRARAEDEASRAALADLAARAATMQGRYDEALAVAEAHEAGDPIVAARLLEDVGLAAGYLGDVERSAAALGGALALHEERGDEAGLLRVHSYRAIVAHRRGAFDEAIGGYRRALELARKARLDDQLPTVLLNLGTAQQEAGDWGGALTTYEDALRYARLLGADLAVATLRFNLANLQLEIGAFERAGQLAERIGVLEGDPLAPLWDRLCGELALANGDTAEAHAALCRARDAFAARGASRDVAECELLLAARALELGDRSELERSLSAVGEPDDEDHRIRVAVLRARHAIERGDPAAAAKRLDSIAATTRSMASTLRAEVHTVLSLAYAADRLDALADEHRATARRTWQRVEATLPPELRDRFRDHPRRRDAYLSAERAVPGPEPEAWRTRLRRFLGVNRKLGSTLDRDAVLEHAVDAAIELTAAERGFVLLADGAGGSFEVASARNLDRERLPRSHLKFSRSIAEEVVASDEPVVTVDAQRDERFAAERSVHAMRLQSVACVPIRGRDAVLGALYLDNRFERGRFADDDVELLMAFADQVAMAVENAELHQELAAQAAELEAARARLETLVRGQARQIETLSAEVRRKQEALEYRYDYSQIIGRSPPMRAVLDTLERVIDSSLTVLVHGESGTGKELVARAIHYNGPRREARMVSLNCAALPENLIESELFGHERGAFTGADSRREGILVSAHGGTVFLDELGDMPLSVQAKLLRALQEREVWPVGASEPQPIDIRLVCATNRDLEAEVAAGNFREDLFYRVSVVRVELPPLRARREDILDLASHFLAEAGGKQLSPGARRALLEHPWPGNVRELQNVISRASVMAAGDRLEETDLDLPSTAMVSALPADRDEYRVVESERIRRTLLHNGWNVSAAARSLGFARQTLYRKLRRYRLERPPSSALSSPK